MKKSDFYYDLPKELIAQTPIEPRDHSRMMVLSRNDGTIEHTPVNGSAEYMPFYRGGIFLAYKW